MADFREREMEKAAGTITLIATDGTQRLFSHIIPACCANCRLFVMETNGGPLRLQHGDNPEHSIDVQEWYPSAVTAWLAAAHAAATGDTEE